MKLHTSLNNSKNWRIKQSAFFYHQPCISFPLNAVKLSSFRFWVYTIFNSCTCIAMSCHTAIIVTLQRWLCYLLHAFCFSPWISPDFARRGCPELNKKVQVQQQKTWKQKEGLYKPLLHWSFKKPESIHLPPSCVLCSLLSSACPLKHVCRPLLLSPDRQSPDTVSWPCTFQS